MQSDRSKRLWCHRHPAAAFLSQAGEVALDDGFGPGKPATRCFSALEVARMQDDGVALFDQQLCSH